MDSIVFDFYLIIFIWYNFSQMYYIRGCENEGTGGPCTYPDFAGTLKRTEAELGNVLFVAPRFLDLPPPPLNINDFWSLAEILTVLFVGSEF